MTRYHSPNRQMYVCYYCKVKEARQPVAFRISFYRPGATGLADSIRVLASIV